MNFQCLSFYTFLNSGTGISSAKQAIYLPPQRFTHPSSTEITPFSREFFHADNFFTLEGQSNNQKSTTSIYQPNCSRKTSTSGPSPLIFRAALYLTLSIMLSGPQAAMAILSLLSVWLTIFEIKAGISGRPRMEMRDLEVGFVVSVSGCFSMSIDVLVLRSGLSVGELLMGKELAVKVGLVMTVLGYRSMSVDELISELATSVGGPLLKMDSVLDVVFSRSESVEVDADEAGRPVM